MSTLDIRTGNLTGDGDIDEIIITDEFSIYGFTDYLQVSRVGFSFSVLEDTNSISFESVSNLKAALDKAQELWGGE